MGVILLITSIGMWWCPSCCLIPRNWISCEDPSTFFCLIVKPAHRRIWIILSPFVKTSLAVSPHAKMSSIYSVCSGALHCSSAIGINPWQIPSWGQTIPSILSPPPGESKPWPTFCGQKNGEKDISNVNCRILLGCFLFQFILEF